MKRGTPAAPLGQPQLNVPPGFPKEPLHRRAADDSLMAKKLQESNVIRLEIESEKGGGGWALAATSALPINSARSLVFQILARLIR